MVVGNWTSPAQALTGFSGASRVAVGETHICALTNAGEVRCWGSNDSGQLGDGSRAGQRVTPVQTAGLGSGVATVATGTRHSCALTASGGVRCWGHNVYGQLGNGTTTDRSVAADVTGLTGGIVAFAGGSEHSCALTTSGAVKCWGLNSDGQLGDGSYYTRRIPAGVSGLGSGINGIAAGNWHSCALTAGGGVKCWGAKESGILGDGTGDLWRTTSADVVIAIPDQLWIAELNAGLPIKAGGPFSVTVESREAKVAGGVRTTTTFVVALSAGTGALNGAECTIPAGGHMCTVLGLTLPIAQSGAVITAHRTAGDSLADGSSPVFTVYPASTTNYQGLWWNPEESGWGINFAHQGNIIFATWFAYDATGKPWWLIAVLTKSDAGIHSGDVLTVSGPATPPHSPTPSTASCSPRRSRGRYSRHRERSAISPTRRHATTAASR